MAQYLDLEGTKILANKIKENKNNKLDKTGGTVTGQTIFNQGTTVKNINSGGGTAGYMYIAQIKINGTHLNQSITFDIRQRERYGTIIVKFNNHGTNDPGLHYINKIGNIMAYIHKVATSTWNLYVQKSEAWDSIDVVEFSKGEYMKNLTVTWQNATVTALPSGYVTASNASIDMNTSTASKLQTARNIRLSDNIIGDANFDGSGNITINARLTRQDLTGKTVDLNTLNHSDGTYSRRYIETTTAGCANISNAPVKEPFILDVELIRYGSPTDYISKQTFTSATTKKVYERYCTSGTWTGWGQVYTTTNKPTKADVGLGNVTNESKATMFTNPTLTGVPTAPNAGISTNNAQLATTGFVHSLLASYGLDGKALRVTISDFNNLTTTGFYTIDNSTGTIANKPTSVAGQDNYFFALVWKADADCICQIVIDYYGKGMWKRICDKGTWNAWSRIYSETNKPTPSEIGAVPNTGTIVNNPNASNFSVTNGISGNLIFTNTGDSPGVARGIGGINGGNDGWAVRGYQTGSNAGALEIAVGDDGNEAIYVRQYTAANFKLPFMNNAGSISNRQITLMEANTGDTHFHRNVRVPGNLTVGQNTAGVITLAIGDTDTGFKWISDGIFDIMSDSNSVARIKKAHEGIQVYKPLVVDGKLSANGDIRVRNKVDMQYNATTESLDFVFV